MKLNYIILGYVSLFLFMLCSVISGSETDSLTLPYEVRLNERQPPDTVLKTIGIRPDMIIGEIGAGRGRYTVQMVSRLGDSGKIYANDIDEDALMFLEKRCEKHGFNNVETILGTITDPKLPKAALDMVIMVNVVHCLDKPVELFENIKPALKKDGFIVIVEGNRDKESSVEAWYSRSKLLKIFEEAGFVLFREEIFLPKDNIYFLKQK